MRRTAIVNLNTSRFIKELKRHYLTIVFAAFFIIGIAFGAAASGKNEIVKTLAADNFLTYLNARINQPIYKKFLQAAVNALIVPLCIFLGGTSLVGVAICPLVVLFKGYTYGALAGYLYCNFSLKGIAFNALMLIPPTLISVIATVICCRLAFNFSLILVKSSIPKGQSVNLYNAFQYYCKQFCIALLLLALSAAVDAIMSAAFLNFFVF